jgi:hypothetical protein
LFVVVGKYGSNPDGRGCHCADCNGLWAGQPASPSCPTKTKEACGGPIVRLGPIEQELTLEKAAAKRRIRYHWEGCAA